MTLSWATWSYLVLSGAIWGCLGLSGTIWGYLGYLVVSGASGGYLGVSWGTWGYLRLSRIVWGHLGLHGAIWSHLGYLWPSGAFWLPRFWAAVSWADLPVGLGFCMLLVDFDVLQVVIPRLFFLAGHPTP